MFEVGKKYLHKEYNIELTFEGEEKDCCWFECKRCGKEAKHIYIFTDEGDSNYIYGSECVKKVIGKIK